MACIPSNMSKLGWDITVVIDVFIFFINAPVLFLQRNANQLLFELFTLGPDYMEDFQPGQPG